jgi:hypothetical protein
MSGWQVTLMPDGSTRLTPAARARWRLLIREEWRVRRGQLERRWSCLGLRRVRRFTEATLWLEHGRHGKALGRALVVRAARERCVVAIGDEAQLRALGALMAERAGWRFRVSQAAPVSGIPLAAVPVPAVLILGGLLAAFAGFFQARSETAAIGRLTPITAADLPSLTPGAAALATGAVGGALADHARRFVFYDLYEYRGRGRYGGGWFQMDSPRPDFQLYQHGGPVPVIGDHALLLQPPDRSREGWRRYEGFRVGDTATVFGRVTVDQGGRRALAAETIFGGDRPAFIRDQERAGFMLGGMGLAAALVGAAMLRAMKRMG